MQPQAGLPLLSSMVSVTKTLECRLPRFLLFHPCSDLKLEALKSDLFSPLFLGESTSNRAGTHFKAMLSSYSIAFDVIQAFGLASTCIILVTVSFNAHLRRLPTWYMIMGSGILYYSSQLLLALSGTQDGREPAFNLCAIQATLIYSAPIAVMASGAAFALQVRRMPNHGFRYLKARRFSMHHTVLCHSSILCETADRAVEQKPHDICRIPMSIFPFKQHWSFSRNRS
jgi:hypothetical protein